MAKRVRVGIIGAGGIGSTHAKSMAVVPEAEVVAMADPLEDRLAEKCDTFGIEGRYADYKRMLKQADLDAVIVGVPNALHAECAIAAFRAGKHVLLEKPMALNARQGRSILAASEQAGKVLQLGMVRRQAAASQVVKQYAESGVLGEIYHMRVAYRRRRGIPGLGGWFTTRAMSGGGALIDIGVHALDMAMWVADRWDPTAASAAVYSKFGSPLEDYTYVGMWAGPPKMDGVFDVDDYASGLIRFGDSATLQFEISWAANSEQGGGCDILGDKGGVRIAGEKVTLYTEQEGRIVDVEPQFVAVKGFEVQAAKFVDACLGRCEPPATGEQGYIMMKVLDAIYRSGETGREVKISAT